MILILIYDAYSLNINKRYRFLKIFRIWDLKDLKEISYKRYI